MHQFFRQNSILRANGYPGRSLPLSFQVQKEVALNAKDILTKCKEKSPISFFIRQFNIALLLEVFYNKTRTISLARESFLALKPVSFLFQSLLELHKRRKAVTEPEARYYMTQLLKGVHYLHSNRVIHRDLKLGNIFLNDDMEVKIGNYSCSCLFEMMSWL